ncbi:hypothetical protein PRIPAC_75958, partial [Pristionchus pacificus]|uniref:Uncharacterized protein n=1 Tax=Pristionchus pacificus TaxID=54126 RepID=A0A2A6CGN8_PRIPA
MTFAKCIENRIELIISRINIPLSQGWSPLSFGLYYSSTADGNTPILNPDNTANLGFQSTTNNVQTTFNFQYMRCTNGQWMVYMSDTNYLAENDPNGDPTNWVMYNNIFCVQPDLPPPKMRKFLLVVTIIAAQSAIGVLSQCACPPASTAITTNEGTTQANFTFAPITFATSADGCDATATCKGWSPLSFGLYYSSTADGNTPILDPDNTANLGFQDTTNNVQSTFDFQYMRCKDGQWMVYMNDISYLAENDPSGDPTSWVMYNNIFCVQPDIPPPTCKFISLIGSRESASFTHYCLVYFDKRFSF